MQACHRVDVSFFLSPPSTLISTQKGCESAGKTGAANATWPDPMTGKSVIGEIKSEGR